MEVEQVLHMNGGVGKTSYANNSLLQRAVISTVKPIVDASIEELCCTLFPECLKVADLGCSSGPNTLLVVSDIIDNIRNTFQKLNRPPPSLQAFLNDLPRNDFNTVFRSLPGFYKKLDEEPEKKLGPCFIAGMPGSFYGRLFPDNSLHFVHSSYALHWISERAVISMVKPIVGASIEELCCTLFPECLKVADLGCSSGPNTLLVVSDIIDSIHTTYQKLNRPPPSLQAFLNDLPGNDFNTVFRSLPGFYKKLDEEREKKFGSCFIAGMPGSFYGRLFPNNSLHFVHSSYALHWISEIPKGLVTKEGEALNKGNIYIAKTSPPAVFKQYLEQFKRDFTVFLRSRAKELVPGGSMVLTTMGSIKSDDPLCIWEFVGLKLNDMVLEGLIGKEKLDAFNMPFYTPTTKEIEEVIQAEGSFILQNLEVFKNDWDSYVKQANSGLDKKTRAAIFATDIRAVGEPILACQFGEAPMDDLFRRFEADVLDHMERENCQFINLVISLTKKR